MEDDLRSSEDRSVLADERAAMGDSPPRKLISLADDEGNSVSVNVSEAFGSTRRPRVSTGSRWRRRSGRLSGILRSRRSRPLAERPLLPVVPLGEEHEGGGVLLAPLEPFKASAFTADEARRVPAEGVTAHSMPAGHRARRARLTGPLWAWVGSRSYECYTTLGPGQARGRACGCDRRSR